MKTRAGFTFGAAAVVLGLTGLRTSAEDPPDWKPRAPDASFFRDCVFICVDVQPGGKFTMQQEDLPEGWRAQGFTVDDVNKANAYTHDVAYPNARKVADACRDLGLPILFVHWGYRFRDGMDVDPVERGAWLKAYGTDYGKWPHHISRPDSRPADHLGVREGEYVVPKTGQDGFTSSNLALVVENLGARNIVFVGGHTGACLGRTAASAKRLGYKLLCVEDATFDARQSARIPNLQRTGYDYAMTTEAFVKLAKSLK